MNDRVEDVDAYITALLDITNGDYGDAVRLVCRDIQFKEPNQEDL